MHENDLSINWCIYIKYLNCNGICMGNIKEERSREIEAKDGNDDDDDND